MDIFDFEEYVESIILERGYNYYINGAVRSLVKSDNRYVAKVDGSILYTVIADLDEDGHIDDLSCDCPYDMGEYCKHEVAVLYALREKYDKGGKAILRKNENRLPKLLKACTEANQICDHRRRSENVQQAPPYHALHSPTSESSTFQCVRLLR